MVKASRGGIKPPTNQLALSLPQLTAYLSLPTTNTSVGAAPSERASSFIRWALDVKMQWKNLLFACDL